mgnify:FL=1
MKNIAIIGAGSYGQEIACLIRKINKRNADGTKWNFIGFFDDNESLRETSNNYGVVLGAVSLLNKWTTPLSVVVAIANVKVLEKIVSNLVNSVLDFPNLIDPDTSFIDIDTFQIGVGNVIGEGCRFSPNVRIGNFNIVVNDSIFGHDVIIGNNNVFFPAVRLSGHVTIGNKNLLGVRTTVLQGFKIGNNVKLSAGSLLMNNARDGFTYRGNPARKFII